MLGWRSGCLRDPPCTILHKGAHNQGLQRPLPATSVSRTGEKSGEKASHIRRKTRTCGKRVLLRGLGPQAQGDFSSTFSNASAIWCTSSSPNHKANGYGSGWADPGTDRPRQAFASWDFLEAQLPGAELNPTRRGQRFYTPQHRVTPMMSPPWGQSMEFQVGAPPM